MRITELSYDINLQRLYLRIPLLHLPGAEPMREFFARHPRVATVQFEAIYREEGEGFEICHLDVRGIDGLSVSEEEVSTTSMLALVRALQASGLARALRSMTMPRERYRISSDAFADLKSE